MRVFGTFLAAIGAIWIVVFGSGVCFAIYQWLHDGDSFNVSLTSGGPVLPHWMAYAVAACVPALGLLPLIVGFKLVMGGRRKP